jgi:tryptophan synthase alpha chain
LATSPDLEETLRGRVAKGGRAFVPYVTGGLPVADRGFLRRLQDAGADAMEVGIPFSDPVMDGPVIQEASRVALDSGATVLSVLEFIGEADLRIPVVVMTYLNPVIAMGLEEFAKRALDAGVRGVIVPDLPVDEASEWIDVCPKELATVFLAAPGTGTDRLRRVAETSRGFVYCVSTYGVTGEREALSGSAHEVVEALRPMTDTPLLVGVGIGTPEQARAACEFADGVVVGSALVRPQLEGRPDETLQRAREFRRAIPD